MAEMGLGYGSEYQLLRFLGHHRIELNKTIKDNSRLKGELFWLDFPKDNNKDEKMVSLSLDGEYKGISFLDGQINKLEFDKLLSAWKSYWSATGNMPNWDGIILNKNGNDAEWIIIEAKAQIKEIESNTKSASNLEIQEAFINTQNRFGISNTNWFGKYYQLANRLAFVNFLLMNNIKASLFYIYFLNGYEKRQRRAEKKIVVENKSVKTREDWNNAIKEEYITLGINDKAKQYISTVFIDCK